MAFIDLPRLRDGYDLVVAGTGFGSLFFVHRFAELHPDARILMVEWGEYLDAKWQKENQQNSTLRSEQTYVGQPGEKPWVSTIAYGGGTNCWWANSPRFHPNDFKLQSLYGVGEDWPITYEQLEPYYLQAEGLMTISGPNDLAVQYPRSGPYPQPPHHLSSIDKIMKASMPDRHFAVPSARLSLPLEGRSSCCMSVKCDLCPVEAKFTALNGLSWIQKNPNIDILTGMRVSAVDVQAGVARGVRFEGDGQEGEARGDLIVLGCNALQTPFILEQSGLDHPALGRYLHEKRALGYEILLDGLDNFDGGIPQAGLNTSWVDGDFRSEAASALIYFNNNYQATGLRTEYSRWRQTLYLEVFVEELPKESNTARGEGWSNPVVRYSSGSDYAKRGIARVERELPGLLSPLPVESINRMADIPTLSHIQGTCRMGDDPDRFVVDGSQRHHQIRNLVVVGTSVWPSCGTANPSLTAAALSLRAAELV